jgi:NMD protein affecting ribosome stability and mRNA decay
MSLHPGVCRCGNRCKPEALVDGLCNACVREAQEKAAAIEKQREFEALKARYLSQHPFYAYMPHGDDTP